MAQDSSEWVDSEENVKDLERRLHSFASDTRTDESRHILEIVLRKILIALEEETGVSLDAVEIGIFIGFCACSLKRGLVKKESLTSVRPMLHKLSEARLDNVGIFLTIEELQKGGICFFRDETEVFPEEMGEKASRRLSFDLLWLEKLYSLLRPFCLAKWRREAVNLSSDDTITIVKVLENFLYKFTVSGYDDCPQIDAMVQTNASLKTVIGRLCIVIKPEQVVLVSLAIDSVQLPTYNPRACRLASYFHGFQRQDTAVIEILGTYLSGYLSRRLRDNGYLDDVESDESVDCSLDIYLPSIEQTKDAAFARQYVKLYIALMNGIASKFVPVSMDDDVNLDQLEAIAMLNICNHFFDCEDFRSEYEGPSHDPPARVYRKIQKCVESGEITRFDHYECLELFKCCKYLPKPNSIDSQVIRPIFLKQDPESEQTQTSNEWRSSPNGAPENRTSPIDSFSDEELVQLFLKLTSAAFSRLGSCILKSGTAIFSPEVCSGLLIAIRRLINEQPAAFLDQFEYPNHPQVTALEKIKMTPESIRSSNGRGFTSEEHRCLANMFDKRTRHLIQDSIRAKPDEYPKLPMRHDLAQFWAMTDPSDGRAAPQKSSIMYSGDSKDQSQHDACTAMESCNFRSVDLKLFGSFLESHFPRLLQKQNQTSSSRPSFFDVATEGIKQLKREVRVCHGSSEIKDKEFNKTQELDDLRDVLSNMEAQYRDEYSKPLFKKIAAKDKQLADKERDSKFSLESHRKREENLKLQIEKVESELDSTKRQLEAAKKEPEKIKEQWSIKLQRLHDKNRDLEKNFETEAEAHAILRLDNVETVRQADVGKARLARFIEQQKVYREEAQNFREERDNLRSRVQSFELVHNSEGEEQVKADKEALQEALTQNEQLVQEIQLLNQSRIVDEKNIRELSSEKEELKKKANDIDSVRHSLAAMEKIQESTKSELEQEKARACMGKAESQAALEKELEEEREKSKRLEAKLAAFMAAAAL